MYFKYVADQEVEDSRNIATIKVSIRGMVHYDSCLRDGYHLGPPTVP